MQPLPPQLELPEGESLLPERPALRRVRSRRSHRAVQAQVGRRAQLAAPLLSFGRNSTGFGAKRLA